MKSEKKHYTIFLKQRKKLEGNENFEDYILRWVHALGRFGRILSMESPSEKSFQISVELYPSIHRELIDELTFGGYFDVVKIVQGNSKEDLLKEKSSLGLLFDTSEFTKEEITKIISLLSEMYESVGGDELEIVGTDYYEFTYSLEPAH